MKKAIVNCLIMLGVICGKRSFGQSLSTEITGLETTCSFSGSFSTQLSKTSKLSFSNTSRISSDYLREDGVKMLINTNLGYSITPKLKSNIGGKYTNTAGLKPSVGLQYASSGKRISWMLFPSYVFSSQPELMTASRIQYLRNISEKIMFVIRMQSLSMVGGGGHLKSALRFRSGIIRGKYQFGAASDVLLSENNFALAKSFGVFMQYQVF
jgi:hypothetical protein